MALPADYRKAKQGEGDCDDCAFSTRRSKGLSGLWCTRYDASVDPEYVCDDYKPKAGGRDSDDREGASP